MGHYTGHIYKPNGFILQYAEQSVFAAVMDYKKVREDFCARASRGEPSDMIKKVLLFIILYKKSIPALDF